MGDEIKITTSVEAFETAFAEWKRRYLEEPEGFGTDLVDDSWAADAAAYFAELLMLTADKPAGNNPVTYVLTYPDGQTRRFDAVTTNGVNSAPMADQQRADKIAAVFADGSERIIKNRSGGGKLT